SPLSSAGVSPDAQADRARARVTVVAAATTLRALFTGSVSFQIGARVGRYQMAPAGRSVGGSGGLRRVRRVGRSGDAQLGAEDEHGSAGEDDVVVQRGHAEVEAGRGGRHDAGDERVPGG